MDNSRPQDQGRPHRKAGKPSAATTTLLAEYQEAMRTEVRALLVELAGVPDPAGLLPDVAPIVKRPSLADRTRIWDLLIKLGRELGTEVDLPAAGALGPAAKGPRLGPRRGRVDYGS